VFVVYSAAQMQTVIPAPVVRRAKAKDSILWFVLVALAAVVRLAPITSGLPYIDYVDEGHVLHQTIDAFNNRSLDVYWYGLPPLPAYCTGAILLGYGPFYRHFHGHRFQTDLPPARSFPSSKLNYDFIAPVELIVAGRMATAGLSIASVILAGIFATRLATKRAGLLAMLLVAVCPSLVTRGSIVIVDTFATFFALLVLYFCARIQAEASKPVWRDVALTGVATGLAFASKYPATTVGVAVILTILMLPVRWGRRLQLLFLAAAGLLFGILLGAPMTFLQPITVWRDIVANVRAYNEIPFSGGYFVQAISTIELGVPLLLVGSVGIILMLWKAKRRTVALGWISFAALLMASYMGKSFRPFRSFLPLIPPLCIAAAIAFSNLIDWTRKGSRPLLGMGLTVVLISCCVVSLGLSSFRQVRQRMAHLDSRTRAIDWLQQHATKEASILGIGELMILPAEWKRIAARSTIVPWSEAADVLRRQRFDYVVTGEFDLRYVIDPKDSSAYRDVWKERVSALGIEADFGQVATPVVPYLWRTNDERILILKGNVP
jgi:4-amino-4-deoxy-L-arabinose transferase-like glycosyltransferase